MRSCPRATAVIAVGVAVALAIGVPRVAAAEPNAEQKGAATVLFREARALMEQGDVAAACRRFEESQRLDPLPGTLLNMAVCHEREGRTATAWVEFRDAAALARRDHRDDRSALAEEHMTGLEPRLSKVRIVVGPRADVPSLLVRLDGSELARPAWDTPLPVDPGAHVVEASAPGTKPFTARVDSSKEGETQIVTVDALEAAAPVVVAQNPPPVVPQGAAPPPATEPGLSPLRLSALVVGGAAIVGIGVGGAFGVDAISKHAASNRACPGNECTAPGVAANDASKTSADASTVAFALALPAVAVATCLWFSGERPTAAAPAALRVMPTIGLHGGGVTIGRAF